MQVEIQCQFNNKQVQFHKIVFPVFFSILQLEPLNIPTILFYTTFYMPKFLLRFQSRRTLLKLGVRFSKTNVPQKHFSKSSRPRGVSGS